MSDLIRRRPSLENQQEINARGDVTCGWLDMSLFNQLGTCWLGEIIRTKLKTRKIQDLGGSRAANCLQTAKRAPFSFSMTCKLNCFRAREFWANVCLWFEVVAEKITRRILVWNVDWKLSEWFVEGTVIWICNKELFMCSKDWFSD